MSGWVINRKVQIFFAKTTVLSVEKKKYKSYSKYKIILIVDIKNKKVIFMEDNKYAG